MAGDDLVPLAAREAFAELTIEHAQLRCERLGCRPPAELRPDPLGEEGVPDWIEPDVRVVHGGAEQIDGRRRRRVDCPLQSGLEASQIEDEPGVGDHPDVAARELEVVRLDAGRRQIAHVRSVGRDLLGGVRERVEGSDDGGALRARAAAASECCGRDESENDSRLHAWHPSTPMRIAIILRDDHR